MKLIDKAAIVAEIERRIQECDNLANAAADNNLSNTLQANELLIRQYKSLLNFIDTIEAKEEILDESGKTNLMQESVREAFKSGFEMGVLQTTNKMNHNTKEVDLEEEIELIKGDYKQVEVAWNNDFDFIARHFYELGLKTKGE